MDEAPGRAQAVLAAVLGAVLIGFAPIAIRLSDLGPQATNFWRFVFALPILLLLARQTPTPARQDLLWLLAAGLLFGFELNLWAEALGRTTIANATLLTNMTPIFAAAFGWLLFKERLAAGVVWGGAVAFAGAVMLTLARAGSGVGPSTPEDGWIGDGLGLISAFGYAGYLLIVRMVGNRASVGAVMLYASLSGAAYTLILCLIFGQELLPHSLRGWAILVGLGVIVQAGGQGLIAYGVGRLPILISTVLLWTQPLAAALLSWLIFGEALGPAGMLGAALILAGLFVVQRARVVTQAKS
jgi:drug/metabolite transporter (DMT)-like permease